mmetsp:Transcript_28231/g.59287  ORF Transcript_28231/g.59287 Transcript_28231/m.59287 type:complete len:166 (-) Transcript_28231:431-928(-)|eukprot:5053378-Pleurochrysis_carterae.AAC.2
MEGLLENAKQVSKDVLIGYESNYGSQGATEPAGESAGKRWQLGHELFLAAEKGNAEEVEKLLVNGAPRDWTGQRGRTALLAASYGGHELCVALLLANCADVNRANEAGVTPLLLAAAQGHLGCVHTLLAAKADTSVRDSSGKTALMWAQTRKHKEVIDELTRATV